MVEMGVLVEMGSVVGTGVGMGGVVRTGAGLGVTPGQVKALHSSAKRQFVHARSSTVHGPQLGHALISLHK
jgi:hypothetical protein